MYRPLYGPPEVGRTGPRPDLTDASGLCLVAGDTNFADDVFVRDRQADTTERVSISSTEEQANASSGAAAITPDGRFVAFSSAATNLVAGDVEDSATDVYLRDRQAGTTEGISTVQPPSGIVLHSGAPSLSADGRLVAFQSWESNLVPGDTNGRFDVFVLDRVSGTVERVSVSSTGVEGNNDSTGPSISADSRLVAFTSDADNLVAGDGNFDVDVFVRDRQTQTTVRASVATDGTETGFELGSGNASLSADGQAVAFQSEGRWCPGTAAFPWTSSCTTSNPRNRRRTSSPVAAGSRHPTLRQRAAVWR
jgi:Tol biopolymer transport system component